MVADTLDWVDRLDWQLRVLETLELLISTTEAPLDRDDLSGIADLIGRIRGEIEQLDQEILVFAKEGGTICRLKR